MPENGQEAFDRGAAAGRRDARLDGHDTQLNAIGGALSSLSDQMRDMSTGLTEHITGLTLKVQELALNAKSSAEATISLAEGVEKERSNAAAAILKEKDKDEKTWTPLTRFLAILAGGVGVTVLIVAIAALYIQSRSGG